MLMNEKRSAERISYQGKPHGALYLRLPTRRLNVQRILDISNNGIRIQVDEQLDITSKVALEYIDGPIRIEVFGMIARVNPVSEQVRLDDTPVGEGYLIGIALWSPMTLIAMIQASNQLASHH